MNVKSAFPNVHVDPDYVAPKIPTACKPDCPICGGVGLVRVDIQDIYDPRFGKLQTCPNIDPVKIYGPGSGLIPDELSWDWPKIASTKTVHPALDAVHKALDRGWGWVTLFGANGVAKTLIEKIAVAQSIKAGKESAYCRMISVINDLRAAFDNDNPSRESKLRLDRWSTIPLLCLDEFDRINETPFATTKRFEMMDRRHVEAERGNCITIIAMNKNPRSLGDEQNYLIDRFYDGRYQVVEMTGPSYRPLINK